jgi:predicted ABC-type transport system involved in lysophospholipase L1 biosynthesis ATPase subunit
MAGFQQAEAGSVMTDGREQDIANPMVARTLGIGMVYQHFTLAPGMTVAENLLLAGGQVPAVIDWKARARRAGGLPGHHAVPAGPGRPPGGAGGRREAEAGTAQAAVPETAPADPGRTHLGADAAGGRRSAGPCARIRAQRPCTVLIITHKFREVMAYADNVTVLRRGRAVHHCERGPPTRHALAAGHGGRRPPWTAPAPERAVSDAASDPPRATGACGRAALACAA